MAVVTLAMHFSAVVVNMRFEPFWFPSVDPAIWKMRLSHAWYLRLCLYRSICECLL